MTTPLRLLSSLACLALLVAGSCALVSDGESLAEMTVKRLAGGVELVRDGASSAVSDSSALEPGDELVTDPSGGRAELRLEGARRIELAPGTRVEVAGPRSVTGLEGSLLAEPRGGDRLSVRFGEARASSDQSLFRVDLGLGASRVGVYRGSAEVVAPGQVGTTVSELFQTDVAANARILSASPLHITSQDRWDQIELAEVLDLDRQLERLGAGLSTQLGRARPALDYFSSLAKRDVRFMSEYLDERVPDLMIGFSIARSSGGPGLKGAFKKAFDLHRDGGRWGLVARILEARERTLISQLSRTILSTGVLAAGSSGEELSFELAAASSTSPSTSGPSGGPAPQGPSGGGPPPNDGGDDPPNDPKDPKEPEDPCKDPSANPVDCVEDSLPPLDEGLLGGGGESGDSGPITLP